MSFSIEWTPSAAKALRKLDPQVRRRVVATVEALGDNPQPSGSTVLAGAPQWRRIRVGAYRVVYQSDADRLVVVVLRVGHRREVYRNL